MNRIYQREGERTRKKIWLIAHTYILSFVLRLIEMSGKATNCIACGAKQIGGVFTCEGCSQTFCMKHANEHRQRLTNELDEIIFQHTKLSQTVDDSKQSSTVLFERIDRWEKDALETIHRAAGKARHDLQMLAYSEKGLFIFFSSSRIFFFETKKNLEQIKEKINQINKQLVNAREHHEYLERDLYQWKIQLEQIKHDVTNLSPMLTVYEDQTRVLIPQLNISKELQHKILKEKLVSSSNVIHFDEQRHTAMHCGHERTPAYVYGTQEYTSGLHEIQLLMSKKTNEFILSFNIISKLMEISNDSFQSEFCAYGWQSDDCVNPSKYLSVNEKIVLDLKGKTRFHLRLFIDCDKQMIRYFNEKTKRSKEIHVNIEKCPFPWKLYFYLYDVGDTIRLLSSSQLS